MAKIRFVTRYRIVRDNYAGFEVRIKPWWSLVWYEKGGSNTFSTVEKARDYALGGRKGQFIEEGFIRRG